MTRTIAIVAAVVLGAATLTACGDYNNPTPSYVCPAYGVPGQPGYHPAAPAQPTVKRTSGNTKNPPAVTPRKPATPKRLK
jgi:hypothetical protein